MPKFRTISGQFVGYVPDGTDPDISPDREPMNGRVTFTPVFTGGVIAFPELSPPEFAHPEPISARIIDGFVQVQVGTDDDVSMQPLSLMVTVDDEASQVWSWRAEFTNMRIGTGEVEVTIPTWSFRVPDGTGPVDLTELVPLKSGGTVDVTKGPRGAGLENIAAIDGQLVFEYTDGQESTIAIPEAVQGPEGPQGPAGADGEQGPQGEKGDPGEIPDLLVGNITDATPTGKNLMLAATEGAARNALGLQTGATSIAGSLEELNNGTQTNSRVWSPKNLSDYTSGRLNTGPNLIQTLKYPVKIAHRGSKNVYPEHSMEAYEASYAVGFTPEADVQALADGTLVCIHDTTTTRTMTGATANVAEMTLEDWQSRLILPPSHDGVSATGYGTPVTFEEYLDRFGGRGVLFVESKGSGNVPAIMQALARRGLLGSVVVQSNAIAGVNSIISAGGTALHLTTSTPTDVAARGATFIGVPSNVTSEYVDSCHAAGLKVIMYTINTKAGVDAAWAAGADGVFSDDPVEAFRPAVPSRSMPLEGDYLAPGLAVRGVSGGNAKVEGGAITLDSPGGRSVLKAGLFGYGADRLRVRFWAQGISTISSSGWMFGIYLGSADGDLPVTETQADGVQWRLLLCRHDGEKRLYRRAYGQATEQYGAQAVTSGPYMPMDGTPGAAMQFEVDFSDTQVICRNLTRGDEPLIASCASLGTSGNYLNFAAFHSTTRLWGFRVSRY